MHLLQERGFSSVPLLAKGKGKAQVNKFAVYFKQKACNHKEEISAIGVELACVAGGIVSVRD